MISKTYLSILQIVRDLAGYSMGRSDLVRRAMSKKKHHVMEEERHNFIHGIINDDGEVQVAGCLRNGISEVAANKIFDSMMDFASYAFNKSHAAAYAVVAYETAYLMRYYPTEFIAAMLNSVMGNNEKVAYYVRFAKEIDIELLSPDINESFSKFTVQGEQIRFGMAAVKNVGVNVIESIVKSRNEKGKFTNLIDFCNKVDIGVVNKRAVESLIKVGAFDYFKIYRSRLLAVYEKIMDGINNQRKKNIDGQISLFGNSQINSENSYNDMDIKYPDIKEFEKKYILAMEKEMTGLYISGHPLDEYKETLDISVNTNISDIVIPESLEEVDSSENYKVKDGDRVVIGGILTEVTKKITRNNSMMAFCKIEDMYAAVELIIFPNVFEKFKILIQEDDMVILKGRVSIREEEQPKIICEDIKPLVKINSAKVYIQIEKEEEVVNTIKEIGTFLLEYKGSTPIYICTKKERKKFMLPSNLWINEDIEILNFLRKRFGEENLKVC